MGKIYDAVFHSHLSKFPNDREYLLPFLVNFDITHAQKKVFKGTNISVFFLQPDQTIQDQFGITTEIILFISDFSTLQPRTIQAIDDVFQSFPARGRVDQTTYFLCTKNDCSEWVKNYCSMNQQSRIPIPVSLIDINKSKNDSWYVRSVISSNLYARDLFNEQLPIVNDQFFFGRDSVVADLINASKQSQNRGVFGLRKTGKTSTLFKFKRMAELEKIHVLYYDCKDPSIRNLRWDELLERILSDLNKLDKRFRQPPSQEGTHISEKFRSTIRSTTGNRPITIIFDEIEFISPIAKLDPHWKSDFIPLWQTIWTTQSQTRRLSFVIAGVNPSVTEIDLIDGIQNPIFGIISPEYLTGLSLIDIRSMMHNFGKRIGLKFDYEACRYMFDRYGGHPLLTRMACSYTNNDVKSKSLKRPVSISKNDLSANENIRESELSFYCRHIINELGVFYPEEYEMLEMLSSGNVADFIELSKEGEFTKHLENYGLVENLKGAKPKFKIPVLDMFINSERMKKSKGSSAVFKVKTEHRDSWLSNRKSKILSDSRTLEALAAKLNDPELYGANGIPEAERFSDLGHSKSKEEFANFINICNRCFVESVENLGKRKQIKSYLYDSIQSSFPEIFDALIRIKVYRNHEFHLSLFENVDKKLKEQLEFDLKTSSISAVGDPYPILQQAVLDGLFVGFQIEIDKRA